MAALMQMSSRDAATALGASHRGTDRMISAVSTDTRSIPSQALFVALRGERFDGHQFVPAALAAGASAAIVDRAFDAAALPASSLNAPLIVVDDTRLALARLATWWRARFSLPAIGIVGSNGKTTTKEMTRAILDAEFGAPQVLATAGNLNNDIGLPLTVFGLRATHRAAVFEIGMNHPGETAVLARVAQATVALVNNAQREHQEFMSSVAEVAAEHGALVSALPADGIAVLNEDDEYIDYWRSLARDRAVRSFGLAPSAMITGRYALLTDGATLEIRLPEGVARTRLQVPGLHNVRNALAAAAAASAAGARPAAVAAGLEAFRPVSGRLVAKRARNGALVIDDTYNANPDSVRAAVDVLAQSPVPRILVLGDMGEVGTQGELFHAEAGEYARAQGITALYALGDATMASVKAFGAGARHFADVPQLVEALGAMATEATSVLIKGSRFMRMERVVNALVEPVRIATAPGEGH